MDGLDPAVDVICRRIGSEPMVVGVGGAVAVGKTTIAQALADEIAARGHTVRVLSTDAFLLSNEELAVRDLLMRKGFPETYDTVAIDDALARLKRGEAARVRVYSHTIYDIVPDGSHTVDPASVVLVEGIVALQPPVVAYVDVAIYVDAPEDIVRGWFVDRFSRLTAAARDDASSFYHRFAALPAEQVHQIAEATWDGINGINLSQHIAPSKANADLVVEKAPDHAIAQIHRATDR